MNPYYSEPLKQLQLEFFHAQLYFDYSPYVFAASFISLEPITLMIWANADISSSALKNGYLPDNSDKNITPADQMSIAARKTMFWVTPLPGLASSNALEVRNPMEQDTLCVSNKRVNIHELGINQYKSFSVFFGKFKKSSNSARLCQKLADLGDCLTDLGQNISVTWFIDTMSYQNLKWYLWFGLDTL